MKRIILAIALALTGATAFAQTKVSALTAASALDGTELVYCVQGSLDRKCTMDQIKTHAAGASLLKASNLSDLTSAGTARTNLGLGTLATQSGTFSGTSSGTNTGDQTTVSGNAGTATALQTARAIYGNNFDGSAALTQIIASTFGGTGNGFTKFSGPTTAERTFTLPDASATLLYSGGALGTPSGGTLTNASGLPSAGITMSTARLLGRTTASSGAAEEITVGAGLSLSAGALTATGGSVAIGDVTGLGTGVATALAVNVGSAGAPVVNGGALGTPSSGTLTNATGLPAAGVVGTAAILGANTFSGHQLYSADNTYDIGASGATRPRNIYAATAITSAGPVYTSSTSYAIVGGVNGGNGTTFGIYSAGDYRATVNGTVFATSVPLGFASSYGVAADIFLTRSAAATLQQGAANAASPVAQTLQAQGSRSGTDTNVAGASYTIRPGAGTGDATPGALIFQTYVPVASGTGTQTATTTLTLNNATTTATGSFILATSATPAAADACTAGRIVWGADFLYVCTSSGNWKRAALTGSY